MIRVSFYMYKLLHADIAYSVFFKLIGTFHVIHQSPKTVRLPLEQKAVPLYCIASGHSHGTIYKWSVSGWEIGANSPVLWTKQPGIYRCEVLHSVKHDLCYSTLISVVASQNCKEHTLILSMCMYNCLFFC